MTNVIIYTKPTCPYCVRAKMLLDEKRVKYTVIDVSAPEPRSKMEALTGGKTVPQILINDQVIGGCDDLYALEKSGQLDPLLK